VSKRLGLIGAIAGVVAAGGAGAVVINRTIERRRRVDIEQFLHQPADRSGSVSADDGISLYYEEVGPTDAPLTVVMVHGFCLRMGEWFYQRRDLAARFGTGVRFVYYDQRSHGRSGASDSAHNTIDQLGQDLHSVIQTLAPRGPLVVVGHSMGGMTVMSLADQFPELFDGRHARVVGVALVSTSAGKIASATLGLPATLARFKGPLLPLLLRGARSQANLVERGRAIGSDLAWAITRRLSFGPGEVDPAVLEYLTTMLTSTRIEVIADFYQPLIDHEKLTALKVLAGIPTLIICGDHDVMTPVAHSREMAVTLPDARLVVVPDAGHLALMEFPDTVTDALGELIDAAAHRR
jgi:pimeloyl-ACP methyl ester carboxylesterase